MIIRQEIHICPFEITNWKNKNLPNVDMFITFKFAYAKFMTVTYGR